MYIHVYMNICIAYQQIYMHMYICMKTCPKSPCHSKRGSVCAANTSTTRFYISLQHTTYTATHYVHCNTLCTLQHVAHAATHCTTLQHTTTPATHCNTCNKLQRTATHCNNCNTLHHRAPHCNTPHNTLHLMTQLIMPRQTRVGIAIHYECRI